MENTTVNEVKGHVCTGESTPQPGKALNFALLVPEGTTWDGQADNIVVTEKLPKMVGLNNNLVLPSPFDNKPCMTVVYIKAANAWREQSPYALYVATSNFARIGITASCPGDGNVYVATGATHLLIAESASQGQVAPALPKSTGDIKSAEIVIGLWCANDDTLGSSAAFKALEARVAALESGV